MNLSVEELVLAGEALISRDDFQALTELAGSVESSAMSWNSTELVMAGIAVGRWKDLSIARRDYFRSQLLSQPSRQAGLRSYSLMASSPSTCS